MLSLPAGCWTELKIKGAQLGVQPDDHPEQIPKKPLEHQNVGQSTLLHTFGAVILAWSDAAITPAIYTDGHEFSNYLTAPWVLKSHPSSPKTVAFHPRLDLSQGEYAHLMPNPDAIPLHEYFPEDLHLQKVAADQAVLITTRRNTPISLENWTPWIEGNVEYQGLEGREKAKIRRWIKQYYVDGVEKREIRDRASAFIWSLKQAARPDTIWWAKSLVDKNSKNNEFIDLVAIGDYLKFYDTAEPDMSDAYIKKVTPENNQDSLARSRT
ncbi:hypothetical protein H4Q26_006388 [Puccinia striiformis f. sp. tritici PST-130]|nr:hypothetical protein H4Q26_006388 [Puccinia striiformis f. sp. tritici PST-130]